MVYLGTLVLSQLKKGEKSFPVPPTKKRCTQNRIRRYNCHWQTTCSEDGNTETLNVKSKNNEEVELTPPPLLLRLYDNPILNMNPLPETIRQGYASAAESVKKALISELTSRDNSDMESMIGLVSYAFASLASLHADYADLYDIVSDFLLYHWELSVAKEELERSGCLKDTEAHHNDLRARLEKAGNALHGAKIVLAKTEKHVTPLVNQIVETRELLKELEEKLNQRNKEIDALQEECNKLEKSYKGVKADEENAAKQVEEHRKIIQPINIRRDEAMTGIERTKVLLSSMR